ncbi:CTL-like protein 2 isoform X1 [Bombyx mandarina]|uniref:Choline transporter-like protein n=2 Tax=Bombyx TaxID=7090 RepID=A0A8R2C746_BOMMO|nr:choline transporter-like 2 isoform X2 [Bombyx mori]XP_028030021.1 CTL-like protein 2 isoform X1 [Bombyx mandarina]XP_028030022.1 CTL-like protein 2 isoform X1 [Bombyx mandarina]XP_028030023.1 CTL-like protein 2 isoform X1 [Bombyx mandarina]
MEKNLGEPIRYDPNFNGPIHNRSCTDVFWIILFLIFLGGWMYIGYYGYQNGNIEKLLAPMDSNGKRCGVDSGVINRKYLLFFNLANCLRPETPITGCPTPQVCVEECPQRTVKFIEQLTSANFNEMKREMVCIDGVNTETMTYSDALQYMNEDKCAGLILQSQSVLFRCIGDLSTIPCKGPPKPTTNWMQTDGDTTCVRNPKEGQMSLFNRATALDTYIGRIVASLVTAFTKNERDTHILSSKIVQDLVQSRWYLAGALLAVVIICFIYIVLLRFVITPIVWASIGGLLALLIFTSYLCYGNYVYYRDNPIQLHQTTNLKGYAQSIFSKASTWMVILIVTAFLSFILLVMVVFLRNRIRIAIALIREGSRALSAVKSTVLLPIFPWIFQCAVIAYWLFLFMSLLSIGTPIFKTANLKSDTNCKCAIYTEDNMDCDPNKFTLSSRDLSGGPCRQATCTFQSFETPQIILYLHLANFLGFFWTMFFITGITDMILASTFATWYWTFHKSDLPFFTLTRGAYRTIRYHTGTVAFGSLIIAIVRVIRVILEYIDHKLKKFENPFTRFIMCCCKCLFWCLESFLKFINKNAFIMCAVHGHNFCKSARDAFSLLLRNVVRVVVLDKVTDFIFFVSKLLISIGIGFAVYYILEWNFTYEITKGQRLNYNYVPAIILSVATYIICTVFFNVYSMAVDTLFLCFLEDCERNDGSPEKPYFMSKNLMKILGKRNKQL